MQSQLSDQIERLVQFIHSQAPDVRVILSSDRFDSEDANLEVYPPLSWTEQECRDLQTRIAEQAIEPLVDYGYLILSYVYKPEQQIAAAKSQLEFARKSTQSAQKILSDAMKLGLIQSDSITLELAIA